MNLDDDRTAPPDPGYPPPADLPLPPAGDVDGGRTDRRRQRRWILLLGAGVAAVVMAASGIALAAGRGDDEAPTTPDDRIGAGPAESAAAADAATTAKTSTTPATSTTSTTAVPEPELPAPDPTTAPGATPSTMPPASISAPPDGSPASRGDLVSATSAIRSACRRFFGYELDLAQPTGTKPLSEADIAAQCDRPAVEFRTDCYAERPGEFTPGQGGCAVLGGHLAVYFGEPAEGAGTSGDTNRFAVGDATWWIYPEPR